MVEYIDIGKIINTHGVRGEVKILPLTDQPERYDDLKYVYIDKKTGMDKYTVESVKYFKSFVILKFKEIQDMNSAETLKDLIIKIGREDAIKLPEGSYFIFDLIGCVVYTEDGKVLGELKEVLQTGSNDVYIVRNENNREVLIPALKSVVREISVKDKKITVSLPEGLVDDEI